MKKTLTVAANYILGSFGVILMVIGFILTTGSLNGMTVDSVRSAEPADLFSSPVLVVLFILLPALLIRGTLGKYISFFRFSSRLILYLVLFTLMTGFIGATGKTYNYFTYADEDIIKTYEDIDILYKRRIDLTTQVEKTLRDYMEYEGEIFTNIAQARSRYFNAASINEKVAAANSLDQGIKSLIVVVESYPDLKASRTVNQYINLVISSENDVVGTKRNYNDKVRAYNTHLRTFPTVIVAKMFGIQNKAYFEENNLNINNIVELPVE